MSMCLWPAQPPTPGSEGMCRGVGRGVEIKTPAAEIGLHGTGGFLGMDITLRASGGGHSGEVISENLQEVGRGSPVPGVPAPGVFGHGHELPWDPEFKAEL